MRENIVKEKSYVFALRIIKLYKYLSKEKKESVLSKQILRCGTSIGANVEEADSAQSKKDFISKMNIALKEAKETMYWLRLLHDSEYIDTTSFDSVLPDIESIIKLLTSIIKSTKVNIE